MSTNNLSQDFIGPLNQSQIRRLEGGRSREICLTQSRLKRGKSYAHNRLVKVSASVSIPASLVVSSPSDLREILQVRPPGRVALRFSELSPVEAANWEEKLNSTINACGCGEAATFLLLALGGLSALVYFRSSVLPPGLPARTQQKGLGGGSTLEKLPPPISYDLPSFRSKGYK
jgi:hypothetical protein